MVLEQTGHLTASGGTRIFYRHWRPEDPRGTIVLVHGANEHGGHYLHVADYFVGQGFQVYAIDHRGHGRSEGARVFVSRFEEYLDDLNLLIAQAQEFGRPIVVGHSMGGLISFHYALRHPEHVAALVLSSPWFRTRVKVPEIQRFLGRIASRIAPTLSMPITFKVEQVTRNPAMQKAKQDDPLFARTFTPRWGLECEKWQRIALETAPRLTVPLLVLAAQDDLIVDPEGARAIFDRAGSAVKQFMVIEGKYHEIFNDEGYEDVFESIVKWLNKQELPFQT